PGDSSAADSRGGCCGPHTGPLSSETSACGSVSPRSDGWAPVPVGCAVCALREGHEGRQTSSAVLAIGGRRSMADIVLINPRFQVSYWGLEHALPLLGKRANMPAACLPLLAALTPPGHTVTLVDENVEPIDFDRCARADVVGITGMVAQRLRMREILAELKRRGAFVVVGGPWATVKEDDFAGLADAVFVGEAERTWPQFLRDRERGAHRPRYEQDEKTDMTTVPVPRFDLLKMWHYAF